jgi:hypothetical protein
VLIADLLGNVVQEKRLQRFAAAQTSSVGTASAGPQSSSKVCCLQGSAVAVAYTLVLL